MHYVYLVFNNEGKLGGVYKNVSAIVARFKKSGVHIRVGCGKQLPIFSGDLQIGYISREKIHN
jgi:hypothetical protein